MLAHAWPLSLQKAALQRGFCARARGVALPLHRLWITRCPIRRKRPMCRSWHWIPDALAVKHTSPGNKCPPVQETRHKTYVCVQVYINAGNDNFQAHLKTGMVGRKQHFQLLDEQLHGPGTTVIFFPSSSVVTSHSWLHALQKTSSSATDPLTCFFYHEQSGGEVS